MDHLSIGVFVSNEVLYFLSLKSALNNTSSDLFDNYTGCVEP